MAVYIAIDDTDSLESVGTGRLAREIAAILEESYPVTCVTRHQFFVHPDIPYTSHNSGAVIHLKDLPRDRYGEIFETTKRLMKDRFVEGSDPGLALAGDDQVSPAIVAFGLDAKVRVLTQVQARALASHAGILLEGLGGTEGGVIGAVAGIGLAAGGSDGRYLHIGAIRERRGDMSVEDLLKSGIEKVVTTEGKEIFSGLVTIPKFPQPVRLLGRAILLVEEQDGALLSVRRD